MREPQANPEEMLARVNEVIKEIRQSDAFPALIGGLAGGIAGALMAMLIASRATGRASAPTAPATPAATKEEKPGMSVQDVVQLATVVASLARQVQTFIQAQKK